MYSRSLSNKTDVLACYVSKNTFAIPTSQNKKIVLCWCKNNLPKTLLFLSQNTLTNRHHARMVIALCCSVIIIVKK